MTKITLDQQIVDTEERLKMFMTLAEREHVRLNNLLKRKFKELSERHQIRGDK